VISAQSYKKKVHEAGLTLEGGGKEEKDKGIGPASGGKRTESKMVQERRKSTVVGHSTVDGVAKTEKEDYPERGYHVTGRGGDLSSTRGLFGSFAGLNYGLYSGSQHQNKGGRKMNCSKTNWEKRRGTAVRTQNGGNRVNKKNL